MNKLELLLISCIIGVLTLSFSACGSGKYYPITETVSTTPIETVAEDGTVTTNLIDSTNYAVNPVIPTTVEAINSVSGTFPPITNLIALGATLLASGLGVAVTALNKKNQDNLDKLKTTLEAAQDMAKAIEEAQENNPEAVQYIKDQIASYTSKSGTSESVNTIVQGAVA